MSKGGYLEGTSNIMIGMINTAEIGVGVASPANVELI